MTREEWDTLAEIYADMSACARRFIAAKDLESQKQALEDLGKVIHEFGDNLRSFRQDPGPKYSILLSSN